MTDSSISSRIKQEFSHWLRHTWSFEDVGKHWDSVENYDDINSETYSYFRRFIDGLRLSDIPNNSTVLDFCSRTGNGFAYFYKRGKVKYGICADVSFKMGEICYQRLHELGITNFNWVPVLEPSLPFSQGSFNAVLCFETVEHFPEPDKLLLEIGRVTKKNGVLVLTTPNLLWEPIHALAAITKLHHSEGPHRFIAYRRLVRMVENAGFDIVKSETTVLIPGGPEFLVRFGELLEEKTLRSLMPILGLRRIIIGHKRC
jgi:SAM-dependent methyltransferase